MTRDKLLVLAELLALAEQTKREPGSAAITAMDPS